MIICLPIPNEANILVKTGEKVNLKTKIFETSKKALVKINIAKKLGIPPEKIFQYLKKFVDEKVTKGDKLASKKTLFSNKKVFSEYDGVFKEINHQTGEITLEINDQKNQQKTEFFSPLIGEVYEVDKNIIKIKIKKGEIIELKEKAVDFFGGQFFILEKIEQIIAENIEKKIIITKEVDSFSQTKCEALGAFGFLTIKKLPNPTNLPVFQFKNIDDINKIKKEKFSYCFIEKNSSKIIFYE